VHVANATLTRKTLDELHAPLAILQQDLGELTTLHGALNKDPTFQRILDAVSRMLAIQETEQFSRYVLAEQFNGLLIALRELSELYGIQIKDQKKFIKNIDELRSMPPGDERLQELTSFLGKLNKHNITITRTLSTATLTSQIEQKYHPLIPLDGFARAFHYVIFEKADRLKTSQYSSGELFRFTYRIRYPLLIIFDCRQAFIIGPTHTYQFAHQRRTKTILHDKTQSLVERSISDEHLIRFMKDILTSQQFYNTVRGLPQNTQEFTFSQKDLRGVHQEIICATPRRKTAWKLKFRDITRIHIPLVQELAADAILIQEVYPAIM